MSDAAAFERALASETAAYAERHPRSRAAMARMAAALPGGDTRTAAWFAPFPLVIDRARGERMWDLDGHELVDLLGNYTSLVHGHAPPAVSEAIAAQLHRGLVFAAPMLEQEDLAATLLARIPAAERVRFANSGTEANMLAARLARAHTGRRRLAVAEHSYHGSWDDLDWDQAARTGTVTFPVDDPAEARRRLEAAGELAAIFVEPLIGAGGVIAVRDELLTLLRQHAEATGAVLVFDEVMSFRLGWRGRQEATGVRPDLTTLGKVIGGGLAIGAVAGAEAIMSRSDPSMPEHVHHSGTFNGHRLAMVAGVAALELLDRAAIDRIGRLGERLAAGAREVAAATALPLSVTHCGSLVRVHAARAVHTPAAAEAAAGTPLARCLHLALLDRGHFVAPRGQMAVSTAMDATTIDGAVAALGDAVGAIERAAG